MKRAFPQSMCNWRDVNEDYFEFTVFGVVDLAMLEDVLAEWERMKKENEEKRKEEVRKRVLEQTGAMFTEFEAKIRDGLLEQLESGKISTPMAAEAK